MRTTLKCFALKYDNNFAKIFKALNDKEPVNPLVYAAIEDSLNKTIFDGQPITNYIETIVDKKIILKDKGQLITFVKFKEWMVHDTLKSAYRIAVKLAAQYK